MSDIDDENLKRVLERINRLLGISGNVTTRGDELKCWVYTEEDGNRYKAYLSGLECIQLSNAFMFLGAQLALAEQPNGDGTKEGA